MSHATAPIPVLPFTSSLLSCTEQSFGAAPMDTAALDKYTTSGLAESVSSRKSGPRQRQHRTEYKGHTPSPRIEIKIPDPKNEPGPTYTSHDDVN